MGYMAMNYVMADAISYDVMFDGTFLLEMTLYYLYGIAGRNPNNYSTAVQTPQPQVSNVIM